MAQRPTDLDLVVWHWPDDAPSSPAVIDDENCFGERRAEEFWIVHSQKALAGLTRKP